MCAEAFLFSAVAAIAAAIIVCPWAFGDMPSAGRGFLGGAGNEMLFQPLGFYPRSSVAGRACVLILPGSEKIFLTFVAELLKYSLC